MPEPDVEPTQVLMAQQTFKGVPPEQAEGPDFQAAVQKGVEGQLGVPAGSVTITSTTEGENGAVIVMYVVQNVEPEDMDNMQKVHTLSIAYIIRHVNISCLKTLPHPLFRFFFG